MITTVKDLIEHLQTFPPDAKVEVLEGYSLDYQSSTRYVPLHKVDICTSIYYNSLTNTLQIGND